VVYQILTDTESDHLCGVF